MDSDSDFLDEFDDGEAQQAIVLLAAENLLEEWPNHGGSRPGRAPNVDRGIQQGHERIIKDYFDLEPVYGEKVFRRRFRIQESGIKGRGHDEGRKVGLEEGCGCKGTRTGCR